jgi:hypothetical protein
MKADISRWLSRHLKGRQLLFVTLTSPVPLERKAFSAALPKFVHRLKRRVLGRKGEDQDLAAVGVLERSSSQGFHAHMILEDPCSLVSTKAFRSLAPISQVIKEEWAQLDIGGRYCAQDVQPVYDLDGAIAYLLKTVWGPSGLDGLDINNLCLPNRSAQTPTSNSHVPPERDNQ